MKKLKRFIPFLLALIMALAIPLAACDSCGGNNDGPGGETDGPGGGDDITKTLQSISLDTSAVKKEYYLNDDFSADGLVVTATFSVVDSAEPEVVTLNAGEYKVDSSAYKKNAEGTYPITVSYTYNSLLKSETYNVSVRVVYDGLKVTLAEGVSDTYPLSAGNTTVAIDTKKIVVKEIDENGEIGNEITDYTVSLYKGDQKIELDANGIANVGRGEYHIWAEKASNIYHDYIRSAFVPVFVVDNMVDFKFESGTLTQTAGEDVISQTWVFTVTYASGETAQVHASDCDFKLDTMTVGSDIAVEVSYTDYSSGSANTKKVTIYCTITARSGKTTYELDLTAFSVASGDALTQDDFTGANAFIKVESGVATYKGSYIEIAKNQKFQVTLVGTGIIKIGIASTGGSNWSRVSLKDASGNYITATYTPGDNVKEDPADQMYAAYGTGTTELTFTITTPGTYTITCEGAGNYGRALRLMSLYMEDNV